MHHLIAKLKGRNGPYLKVFSDENIFELPPDLDKVYIYDPDYKLEEDQWFCIDDFQTEAYSPNILKIPFISTDYNQIQVAEYNAISHLCSVQDHFYFFQKVQSSSILKRKWFSISQAPRLVQNEPIIILNNLPDAVYDSLIDRMYFKNLSAISGIFRGIDILFREATQVETTRFLRHRIESEEDLRWLLWGIQERYYTTRRGEKRLANSIRPLNKTTP